MDIATEIKKLLLQNFLSADDYHIADLVDELVEYLEKMSRVKHPSYTLPYREYIRVFDWNDIRDQIKNDILDGDPGWFDKKEHLNKSDFERGVLAAIALITHRIDCIID